MIKYKKIKHDIYPLFSNLEECIYNGVAYTPKLAGYPTLSDINKVVEIVLLAKFFMI